MRICRFVPFALAAAMVPALAQTDGDFHLALPRQNGLLNFSAPGYKIIQHSAKPDGNELGLRGSDASGEVHFLVFLFNFSQQAPLTSARCRDGEMGPEQKANHSLKILANSEIANPGALPVSLVDYSAKADGGKTEYMARGFIATGSLCGDLEFYSDRPIHAADDALHRVFASLQLDPAAPPQYKDELLYAQILFDSQFYAAAGPIYELALQKLPSATGVDVKTMTRVLTDQAGMSYGISGNLQKASALFENGIATDPGYPMYYYNLACADAEAHNLVAARQHLQQAFDRKANMISGETFPDPTQDDSFTRYRNDKQFWSFVESLRPH
jgi:tetratricopeptide (TPR) repeat protein